VSASRHGCSETYAALDIGAASTVGSATVDCKVAVAAKSATRAKVPLTQVSWKARAERRAEKLCMKPVLRLFCAHTTLSTLADVTTTHRSIV
jgi:hypothetical protein